jgi:exopolysaccharide biosynthesis polyprenyl glycosylphosphotransferase
VPGGDRQGGLRELEQAVAAGDLDRVFLALSPEEGSVLAGMIERLMNTQVEVAWVPDIAGLAPGRLRLEEFAGVPVLPLGDFPLLGWNGVLKRSLDIGLSAVGLTLLLPALAGIGILIRLGSPGPALYRQERVGRDGRRFQMLKFRSMVVDAEATTGPTRTARRDPRVTGIGRFLRRTSMDELPQLWNVLSGEMSLVGPRPERPALISDLVEEIPDYVQRHRVKAGMTGYAQMRGLRGADTSMQERILCDLYYIEHWSLGLDLRIMLRTVLGIFREPNAY